MAEHEWQGAYRCVPVKGLVAEGRYMPLLCCLQDLPWVSACCHMLLLPHLLWAPIGAEGIGRRLREYYSSDKGCLETHGASDAEQIACLFKWRVPAWMPVSQRLRYDMS
jgi:hypothetical protein